MWSSHCARWISIDNELQPSYTDEVNLHVSRDDQPFEFELYNDVNSKGRDVLMDIASTLRLHITIIRIDTECICMSENDHCESYDNYTLEVQRQLLDYQSSN